MNKFLLSFFSFSFFFIVHSRAFNCLPRYLLLSKGITIQSFQSSTSNSLLYNLGRLQRPAGISTHTRARSYPAPGPLLIPSFLALSLPFSLSYERTFATDTQTNREERRRKRKPKRKTKPNAHGNRDDEIGKEDEEEKQSAMGR
ncbi:hypothetical protein F4778DRAFT_743644 [Xylariomycetidae sp. FL2044]|nr:hypothetical protein F4778DRAFT_743644 [Xylariomycetidae sp. FL2044]